MKSRTLILSAIFFAGIACTASAEFVDDEFNNQAALGSQWTWNAGTPAGTVETTPTAASTHLSIMPAKGSDMWMAVDTYSYIEQDQPSDDAWEVVTRIDNWSPKATGHRQDRDRVGLMLWQDNNHWVAVTCYYLSSYLYMQGVAQFDPNGDASTLDKHRVTLAVERYPGTANPLYLRIRKCSKGYIGAVSEDAGASWRDWTTFLKNPHTSDGLMASSAKIRIFRACSATSAGTISPAEIDWVRKTTLTPPTAGYANDEFDGAALGNNWVFAQGLAANLTGGNLYAPGSVSLAGGKATLAAGLNSDLGQAYNSERATLMMQDAPTVDNYSLIAQFDTTDYSTSTNWAGHGLRLWQDQNHWFFIGMGKNSTANNIVETKQESDDGTSVTSTTSAVMGAVGPGYLRIDKQGDMMRTQYSFDGTNWIAAPGTAMTSNPDGWVPFPAAFRNAQIQVFAKKPGTTVGTTVTPGILSLTVDPVSATVGDWQAYD